MSNKTIWIALVRTESGDTYTWPFESEPTRDQVIDELVESEGGIEDREWYDKTTSVRITPEVVYP